MFAIAAIIYFVGAMTFIFFGSGDIQKWAMRKPQQTTEVEEMKNLKT